MSEDVPAQMAQILRGKIASCTSENRKFAGQLEKVQAELNSQRDKRYLNLSSENRELREKSEKLQELNKELDEARTTISNQAIQLEALLEIKAERDRAKEEEKAIRVEAEKLKKQVEDLTLGKAAAVKKAAEASAGGFQHAVNLSFTLAPWLAEHSSFFDGRHYIKDKKVWLEDQMVYDPALHANEEEEGGEDQA